MKVNWEKVWYEVFRKHWITSLNSVDKEYIELLVEQNSEDINVRELMEQKRKLKAEIDYLRRRLHRKIRKLNEEK